MSVRIDYTKVAPAGVKALGGVYGYILQSGLSDVLVELVYLRISQINGCAYCVDMHVKEARHDGLSEQWINLMSVWHEALVYDAKERALLAWVDVSVHPARCTRSFVPSAVPRPRYHSCPRMIALSIAALATIRSESHATNVI